MSRSLRRLALVATAIGLFAAMIGVSSASAAELVTNGGFETGTLEGWQTSYESEAAEWFAYNKAEAEEAGLVAPPSGNYAAGDGFGFIDSAVLFQNVTLPAGSEDQLSMDFGYRSSEPMGIATPNTLEVKELGGGNQQVRIDVLKAGSPLRSLEPGDILKTVYATEVGSPEVLEPTVLTANLSPFAGQTVILRIANVVEDGPMNTVVDDVSIASTPLPTPPAPPTPTPPPPPSNVFTKGKLRLNKKTGTATLAVNVPDAGTLTATDVRSKVAMASLARSTTKAKAKPVYVKSATVSSTGAGMIRVPIKPTAGAKKVLAKTGKLAVKVRLTFTPAGGTAATQGYTGKLVKKLAAKPPAPK